MLDALSRTTLVKRPAPFWRRFLAFLVDLCILSVGGIALAIALIVALGFVCTVVGCAERWSALETAKALVLPGIPLGYLLLSWWWPGRGQTFGMRSVGLRIVQLDGAAPDLWHSGARLLAWAAVAMPSFWLSSTVPLLGLPLGAVQAAGFFGLIGCVVFRRDRRGLHDLIARTIVVTDA